MRQSQLRERGRGVQIGEDDAEARVAALVVVGAAAELGAEPHRQHATAAPELHNVTRAIVAIAVAVAIGLRGVSRKRGDDVGIPAGDKRVARDVVRHLTRRKRREATRDVVGARRRPQPRLRQPLVRRRRRVFVFFGAARPLAGGWPGARGGDGREGECRALELGCQACVRLRRQLGRQQRQLLLERRRQPLRELGAAAAHPQQAERHRERQLPRIGAEVDEGMGLHQPLPLHLL